MICVVATGYVTFLQHYLGSSSLHFGKHCTDSTLVFSILTFCFVLGLVWFLCIIHGHVDVHAESNLS